MISIEHFINNKDIIELIGKNYQGLMKEDTVIGIIESDLHYIEQETGELRWLNEKVNRLTDVQKTAKTIEEAISKLLDLKNLMGNDAISASELMGLNLVLRRDITSEISSLNSKFKVFKSDMDQISAEYNSNFILKSIGEINSKGEIEPIIGKEDSIIKSRNFGDLTDDLYLLIDYNPVNNNVSIYSGRKKPRMTGRGYCDFWVKEDGWEKKISLQTWMS